MKNSWLIQFNGDIISVILCQCLDMVGLLWYGGFELWNLEDEEHSESSAKCGEGEEEGDSKPKSHLFFLKYK